MDSSLSSKLSGGMSSTWVERLFMNLLSYSIVLLPIAFIVIVTKYRLCPVSFESFAPVQWFVYGSNNLRNKPTKTSELTEDEKSLLDDKTEKNRPIKTTSIEESRKSNVICFLWCLFGLHVSYLIWGILQEKIMTTEYPANDTGDIRPQTLDLMNTNLTSTKVNNHSVTFHDSQFLVFVNRIVAFITAIIALVLSRKRQFKIYQSNRYNLIHHVSKPQSSRPQAPLFEYVYCSLSNILSSWCQYEALKYINFPTQCLSKSCKVIPVMLMSRLLLRRKYPLLDYFCAFLLATGMFIFMFNQPPNLKNHSIQAHNQVNHGNLTKYLDDHRTTVSTGSKHLSNHGGTLISGLLILALYLTFDSFTSNWQQSLYGRYGISNWQMMAAINFYSILLTLTSLHQLGNLRPAIKLLASSNILIRDLICMSIMSSIGQMFVYYTIKRFGSVLFAVIMTLRQFLSILLSCAIYGHKLDLKSSLGLILVFLVVGFQVWHKSKNKKEVSNSNNRFSHMKLKTESSVAIQFRCRLQDH